MLVFESLDKAVLRHLALLTRSCVFLPNEYIVQSGDVKYELFFIYRGTVREGWKRAESERLSYGFSSHRWRWLMMSKTAHNHRVCLILKEEIILG